MERKHIIFFLNSHRVRKKNRKEKKICERLRGSRSNFFFFFFFFFFEKTAIASRKIKHERKEEMGEEIERK